MTRSSRRFEGGRRIPKRRRRPPAAALLLHVVLGGVWASSGGAQQGPAAGPRAAPHAYRVQCAERAGEGEAEAAAATCATDLVTYIGWRVFERYCASCHGTDAEGSTFAPSLVHRVGQLDRSAFFAALDRGYSGNRAPMRPWGEHREVSRYYEELWSYLSARAAGELPPGPLVPLR
ncbi:MAG TPA: cytochrome c [Gammaproteobacteria bacterium]